MFLVLMCAYPLVVLVRMSVSTVTIANFLRTWPYVALRNFQSLLRDTDVQHAAVITLEYLVVLLAATLVVGVLIAVVLNVEHRLTRFTQSLLILVWMMPPVVLGSLWKFLAASDGVLNGIAVSLHLLQQPRAVFAEPQLALWGVAVVSLWVSLPFAAVVIKAALLDVPLDVLDAAKVDGAGAARTLWSVVLPMIRPTLLILSVLTIVFAFKSFEYFYVLTQGGPGTASTTLPYLGYELAFQSYRFSDGAAVAVLCMLVTTVLAVVYARTVRHEEAAS